MGLLLLDSQGERSACVDDVCTYRIEVRGQVDERDLNAGSPLRVTVEWAATTATSCTIRADQSGLVGLIRHLHGRGFVLLSVCSDLQTTIPRRKNVHTDCTNRPCRG